MTPGTPLCAQQSRKPTPVISLTCIHSVFSIMQCVSGEKKNCLGFFFFFFQTWPTNKRCRAFVSFVHVVLFSCVSLLAGLLQGPGGGVATGHSSDSEAYSAPPGGRGPSQKCLLWLWPASLDGGSREVGALLALLLCRLPLWSGGSSLILPLACVLLSACEWIIKSFMIPSIASICYLDNCGSPTYIYVYTDMSTASWKGFWSGLCEAPGAIIQILLSELVSAPQWSCLYFVKGTKLKFYYYFFPPYCFS